MIPSTFISQQSLLFTTVQLFVVLHCDRLSRSLLFGLGPVLFTVGGSFLFCVLRVPHDTAVFYGVYALTLLAFAALYFLLSRQNPHAIPLSVALVFSICSFCFLYVVCVAWRLSVNVSLCGFIPFGCFALYILVLYRN